MSAPRPQKLPIWATTGVRVEPAAPYKAQGWLVTNPPQKPPAQYMNWLQGLDCDWTNFFEGVTTGRGWYLFDDFDGSAVNTSRWIVTGGGHADFVQDAAGVGHYLNSWKLKLLANAGGGGASIELATGQLALQTEDFYVSFIARASTATINGIFAVILGPVWIYSKPSSFANWQATTDNTVTNHDLNVLGTGADAAYHFFEIARISGTVYFIVDGTIVTSIALATLGAAPTLSINADAGGGGSPGEGYIECIKAWFDRAV